MGSLPPLPPYLTLEEAANAMSARLGQRWTTRTVLGAAARHQITIYAALPHSVRLVRSKSVEGDQNEIDFPAGSLPPISSKVIEAMLLTGKGTFDGWDGPIEVNLFGTNINSWSLEWIPAPGENGPEILATMCRVSKDGITNLAEKHSEGSHTTVGHKGALQPLVPTMLTVADAIAVSGYAEETVFDLGIGGSLIFLVVVPGTGACRVPAVALSHFMAGADKYTAYKMPEHYSGALSERWTIKRERLRILAESWSAWGRVGHDVVVASGPTDGEVAGTVADVRSGRWAFPMHEGRPLAEVYAEQEALKRDAGRYTLEEAAELISRKAGESKAAMLEKLVAAAKAQKFYLYQPGKLARYEYRPGVPVRTFYEQAFWDDLNVWLDQNEPRIAFRFRAPAPGASETVPVRKKNASAEEPSDLLHWKMRVQAAAAEHWKTLRKAGANPTVSSILDWMAKWCCDNAVFTDSGINPSAGYLRTHVLGGKHWTPPR